MWYIGGGTAGRFLGELGEVVLWDAALPPDVIAEDVTPHLRRAPVAPGKKVSGR